MQAEFMIGAEASCADGSCGEVVRVVVDPIAGVVTHLVVGAAHGHGLGRLVPVGLVEVAAAGVWLRCSLAEFSTLGLGEEGQFRPGAGAWGAYGAGQVLAWPYYRLGGRGGGGGMVPGSGYDGVPLGEVCVRRGEHVRATDGLIGRVQGLVIDPGRGVVTHVLLQEGHLWGRAEVAIPISAVAGISGGIRLRIAKRDVQDLPPVDVAPADG